MFISEPGYRIRIFHAGFRVKKAEGLESRIRIRNNVPIEVFLTQNFFPSWIPHPEPGSRGQKGTGSWIHNTALYYARLKLFSTKKLKWVTEQGVFVLGF